MNGNVAYAGTLGPEPVIQNEVVKCNILNTNEFDNNPKNTVLNEYFSLYCDNSEWGIDLPFIERFNRVISLQYFGDGHINFRLKKNIGKDYLGKNCCAVRNAKWRFAIGYD